MSRGKEIVDKETDEEEVEGGKLDGDEDDYGLKCGHFDNNLEDSCQDYTSKGSEEFFSGRGPWILSNGPSPKRIRKLDTCQGLHRVQMCSSGGLGKPQDADYSDLSQLNHELEPVLFPGIPSELETMILARLGVLEYRKLCFLGPRLSQLVKSGDMLRARKISGLKEAFVFMLASGDEIWSAFDHMLTTHMALPRLPCDEMFELCDKETLCAGTHLLVCGTAIDGPVIWRHEVMMGEWFKGPSMVEPRCLFASASSGDFAFVAGGLSFETNDVCNSAEKYDPETKSWTPLPKMKEERKMCAGCYMDNKFYVVGGQGRNGEMLTCAEVLDEERSIWVKIRDMLKGLTTSQSPPLIAAVKNDLYMFETTSNSLMVYLKDSNTWKNMGPIPVRADFLGGWGVAFKSLGNELLVIGGSTISLSGRGMTMYTCCPNPKSKNQNWKLLDGGGENRRSHYIRNCTVMVA